MQCHAELENIIGGGKLAVNKKPVVSWPTRYKIVYSMRRMPRQMTIETSSRQNGEPIRVYQIRRLNLRSKMTWVIVQCSQQVVTSIESLPHNLDGSVPGLPVGSDVVSLLFCPTGCKRSMGIFGNVLKNLPPTIGPTINKTKTMSMTKYKIANRITLRLRSLDCLSE